MNGNKGIYSHRQMKVLRENTCFRFLWFFMALLILNSSVDTPDPQPEYVPEDLSFNDMESVVEIILEQVLNIDNAISETDDNDSGNESNLNLKKGLDLSYYQSHFKMPCQISAITASKFVHYEENYTLHFHPELIPPPPKV